MPDSYASIFGVEAPQFEKSSTVVELDYVKVVKDEPDLADIIHPSVKTGHKEWTRRGKHWVFEVIVNLTKYGSNAYDKYQELKSYKYSLVDKLWKRRDGNPVQNEDDEYIKFFIEEIKEFYFDHYLYPDRLLIRFVSQNPVDIVIFSSSPTYSDEALIYINQLDVLPPSDIVGKIAEFIDGLVADGVYSKIDEMWLMAMNNENNAMKGMKGYLSLTKVGSPVFTAYRGYKGSIGNYLRTNYRPSFEGINYSTTSASLGIYSRTNIIANSYDMGSRHGTIGNSLSFLIAARLPNFGVRINTNVLTSPSDAGSSLGFFVGNLNYSNYGASRVRLYRNGSLYTTGAQSSSTPVDYEVYITTINSAGTPLAVETQREYSFAFVGGELLDEDVSNFHSRLETLLDYVGAGVV